MFTPVCSSRLYFVQIMARKYNFRSLDDLMKTLTPSEIRQRAFDIVTDEEDNVEEISGSESEEEADNEEFRPLEQVESENSDANKPVPNKRQKRGRSITRDINRSDHGQRPNIISGKDGHRWYTTPREQSQDQQNPPTSYLPSPVAAAKEVNTPFEAWNLLFPDSLLQKIVRHTNEEIYRYRDSLVIDEKANRTYSEISLIELKAYIGLLYFAGLQKTSKTNLEELWSADYGCIRYRATMSRQRFVFISRNLRFDDKSTRLQRREIDKFAPIREVWEQFLSNCTKYYSPGSYCTIDEQLVSFHGRCPFKVYNGTKPDKYGIKIVMLNDTRTFYMFSAEPYAGKVVTDNGESVQSYYIRKLSKPLHGTKRNITCDNWFSSISIFEKMLKEYSMTMVGTLRKNKGDIPENFKCAGPESSSKFVHDGNMTLVAHTPKTNKIIILLSTFHHTGMTNQETQKPEIIEFYNSTKGGTETFNHMCNEYSTYRKTLRWPMRIWMAMLDQGGINAIILHNFNADLVGMSRRQFIQSLVNSLLEPYLRIRLQVPTLRREIRTYISILLDENVQPVKQTSKKPARCGLCPRAKDRKVQIYCEKCQRPSCEDHRLVYCTDCGAHE